MALLLDKNEHERPFGKRLPMQWQELVSLMMFVERETSSRTERRK